MIVIATNNGKKHLIELLENLNQLGIKYPVSIIDTQSTDQETVDFLNQITDNNPYNFKISVYQTPYRGFDSGAYMYAINNIKSDRFYFLQDSLRIKDPNFFNNINEKLKPGIVVPLITFASNLYDGPDQIEFCLNNFEDTKFTKGIFGPMFSVLNEDIQKIDKKFLIWPTNKRMQMGMERGWGILFDKYEFIIDSLEGDYDYGKLINDQYLQFKKIINYRG
jgi:hypothetical protein